MRLDAIHGTNGRTPLVYSDQQTLLSPWRITIREVEALLLVKMLKQILSCNRMYWLNLHFVIDPAGDSTSEVHWSPKTSKKKYRDS